MGHIEALDSLADRFGRPNRAVLRLLDPNRAAADTSDAVTGIRLDGTNSYIITTYLITGLVAALQ